MEQRLDSFFADPALRMLRLVVWAITFALPLATGVLYLVLHDDLWWWLGVFVACMPLFVLVELHQEWLERNGKEPVPPWYGGMSDGPWGAP